MARDFPPDLPRIEAYGGELNQVWTNLIDNAVDAMEANGKGKLIIRTERDHGYAKVSIIDNGPGIPEDIRNQIFDPFFTTRRNEGGTGLGLHIVYNLVTQQLGGRMMLESRLGQGTTFRIIMPRAARRGSTETDIESHGTAQWPTRTMSSN